MEEVDFERAVLSCMETRLAIFELSYASGHRVDLVLWFEHLPNKLDSSILITTAKLSQLISQITW